MTSVPLAKAPPAGIMPIIEDYSDLAEEDELESKVLDFKVSVDLTSEPVVLLC